MKNCPEMLPFLEDTRMHKHSLLQVSPQREVQFCPSCLPGPVILFAQEDISWRSDALRIAWTTAFSILLLHAPRFPSQMSHWLAPWLEDG